MERSVADLVSDVWRAGNGLLSLGEMAASHLERYVTVEERMPIVTKQTRTGLKPGQLRPGGPEMVAPHPVLDGEGDLAAIVLGGIIGRIKPMGLPHDRPLKMLVYGESGTGKTTFWATFPKPILVALCSGVDDPGELLSLDVKAHKGMIEDVTLLQSSELEELAKDIPSRFKTIVLDHVSGYQDLVLREILGVEKLPEQIAWGDVEQKQWGVVAGVVKNALKRLLECRCNVVIVGQQRHDKPRAGSQVQVESISTDTIPSIARWLNPTCDFVVQTVKLPKMVEEQTSIGGEMQTITRKVPGASYCLRTGPDDVVATKFRVPKGRPLPDFIVDPDHEKVMRIIRGEWK